MNSSLPPFFHHTLPVDRAPHAGSPTREAGRIGSDDGRGSEEHGVRVAERGEEGVASGGRRGGDQSRSLVAYCKQKFGSQAENTM